MPIEFHCSKCYKRIVTSWGSRGTIRCPQCGGTSTIPTVKDTIKEVEKRIHIAHVRGTVISAETTSTPLVSGSGAIHTDYRPLGDIRVPVPIPLIGSPVRIPTGYADTSGAIDIRTTVKVTCRIWVREPSGRESLIESGVGELPIRIGQVVSAVFAEDTTKGQREFIALANHTSNQSIWVQDPTSILRRVGFEPTFAVEDTRTDIRRPSISWRELLHDNSHRVGLCSVLGSSGLLLFAIGIVNGIVLLAGLGALLMIGCTGWLWGQISYGHRLQSEHLLKRKPTIRCSIVDEWAGMVRAYFAHHLPASPSLP
jgi:DNA-directed RNA polymerase subunit RPC12/RpoP